MKKNFEKRSIVGLRKMLLIMKLVFALIFSSFVAVSANTYSQVTKLSLDFENATVKEVFEAIEKQSEYIFFYQDQLVDLNKEITIDIKNKKINNVLNELFEGTDYIYRINDRQIIISSEESKLELKKIEIDNNTQEQIEKYTITGKITDKKGGPLPGASVVVKNTVIGAATDIDGNFTLKIPEDAMVLVVSFTGYYSKEINIGTKTEFIVVLEQDITDIGEVVAVGYKKQNVEAIKAKRSTIAIGEFLSQDEIGRLPDFAAADAARRIAGVNTIFQEDEATQVSVRGLAPIFTYSTIDGMFLPSGDRGSRIANFETLPSSAIKTIEVYKSRTADKDGNAIGGIFNLKTRSAFDSDDLFVNGHISTGKYTFDEIPRSEQFRRNSNKNGLSVQADATISKRFGNNKQFGIIASGSYNRKDRDEFKVPKRNYNFLDNDPTKPVPDRFYFAGYDNLIKRYGGFAKIEYKPSDNFYVSISGNMYEKKDDEVRIENRFRNLEYDENSVSQTGGRFSAARVQIAYDHFLIEHKMHNAYADMFYKFGKSEIDAKLGYSYGYLGEDGPWGGFNLNSDQGLSGSYTLGKDKKDMSLSFDNPDFYLDPNNWDSFYVGGRGYRDDEDAIVGKFNYAYNMNVPANEVGWGFKTGYSYRNIDHKFNRIDMKVNVNDGVQPITFADFPLPFYNTNTFNKGKAGLIYFDNEAFESWVAQNTNTNGIDNAFDQNYNRAYTYNLGNYFRIEESIQAFYGMARYKGLNFTLTAGLRYESTKTDLTRIPEINDVRDENITSTQQNNYSNWLPSLNATLDLSPQIRLKAAYYKAIGRGNYQQIAPVASVNDAEQRRSQGNPDLKPRNATNYDIQFEYYFDGRSSLLAFGFFHKNIKDDIRSDEFIDPTDGYTVTTNFNGLSVDVSGFELNFIKGDFKGILPGFMKDFGISSNFTFLSGRREVEEDQYSGSIQSLPRTMLNSQLFYQKNKFDARIAWSHVGFYVKNANDNNPGEAINDDQYWKPFNQFDLSANYRLTDNLSVFSEWKNFTNANRGFTRGKNLLIEDTEFGSSIWLGLTFKL
jgi:TonB-dependent receptor